jgi:hypothetical protein
MRSFFDDFMIVLRRNFYIKKSNINDVFLNVVNNGCLKKTNKICNDGENLQELLFGSFEVSFLKDLYCK